MTNYNLRIPEEEAESTDPRETNRANSLKIRGKEREKKRNVGLSYTEAQHRQA